MIGRRCFAAGAIAVLFVAVPAGAQTQGPVRLSAGDGTWAGQPTISPNGRYVAFSSDATDLVDDDTNGQTDVFLYDTQTEDMTIASVSSTGTQGDWPSYADSVSNDGDVAFTSSSNNLASGDSGLSDSDVYVHELSGDTERIGLAALDPWSAGNGGNYGAMISANGNRVAYYARVPGEGFFDATYEIHLYDRAQNDMDVVVSSTGMLGYHDLSADGSTIAIETPDSLLSADTDDDADIYLYDVSTAGFTLASVDDWTHWEAITPAISNNGQFVAYQWDYCVPDSWGSCTADEYQVRVYNSATNQTTRATSDPNGNQPIGYFGRPAISGDGRYVTFVSDVSTLTNGTDDNDRIDVFVRDRDDHETHLVSKSSSGQLGDEESGFSAVASDGTIAFESYASNLVSGDGSWTQDVFLIEP